MDYLVSQTQLVCLTGLQGRHQVLSSLFTFLHASTVHLHIWPKCVARLEDKIYTKYNLGFRRLSHNQVQLDVNLNVEYWRHDGKHWLSTIDQDCTEKNIPVLASPNFELSMFLMSPLILSYCKTRRVMFWKIGRWLNSQRNWIKGETAASPGYSFCWQG